MKSQTLQSQALQYSRCTVYVCLQYLQGWNHSGTVLSNSMFRASVLWIIPFMPLTCMQAYRRFQLTDFLQLPHTVVSEHTQHFSWCSCPQSCTKQLITSVTLKRQQQMGGILMTSAHRNPVMAQETAQTHCLLCDASYHSDEWWNSDYTVWIHHPLWVLLGTGQPAK